MISFSLACTRSMAGNLLEYRKGKQFAYPFASFHTLTINVKNSFQCYMGQIGFHPDLSYQFEMIVDVNQICSFEVLN